MFISYSYSKNFCFFFSSFAVAINHLTTWAWSVHIPIIHSIMQICTLACINIYPPPPLTCPHFVLLQLGTEMDLFGIMRHESTQNSPFYYYYLCKALYLELHQCLDFLSILSHYSTDIDGIKYVYVYGMYMCVCVCLTQITPSSHLSGYCMA